MNITAEQIATLFEGLLGDSLRPPLLVALGNPQKPANDNIFVPLSESDHPGMVWVHGISGEIGEISGNVGEGDQQFVMQAVLTPEKIRDGLMVFGTPLYIRRQNGRYHVIGLGGEMANEYLYGLRDRTQRSIDISQFDAGLIRPTAPPTGRVLVTTFPAVVNGTAYRVPTLQSSDLIATYEPGLSDGQAKAILIECDAATNTLYYTASSAFTNATHDAAFTANYPKTITDNRFLVGWVKIHEGMTSIQIADILHGQEVFGKGGGVTLTQVRTEIEGYLSRIVVDGRGNVVTADGEVVIEEA